MAYKKRRGHKTAPKRKEHRLAPPTNGRRKTNPVTNSVDEVDVEVSERLSTTELSSPPNRRGDNGRLLLEPRDYYKDIKLIQSCLGKGYNVRRKTMMRRRLEEIAAKREADVITKDGVVNLESAGDKLAIEAIKALEMMDKLDMQRIELGDKLSKDEAAKPPATTVINVQDNSTTFNGSPVADRRVSLLRLAERIGASELVIDGETVRPGELPKPTVPLSDS